MFNLGKVAPYLLRAVAVIPAAVQTAQTLTHSLKDPNADKQAAVVDAARAELAAAEAVIGRDLSNESDVIDAIRAISDAVVRFHKLIASKVAAAPTS